MMKTKPSRLAQALLETADDIYRTGVVDMEMHEKIMLRHLGDKAPTAASPMITRHNS